MAFTNDQNPFQDFNEDEFLPPEDSIAPGGGGGGNRNFLIGIIIIAVVFVLAVGGLVAYVLLIQGPNRANQEATAAYIYAQNTQIVVEATNQAATAFAQLTPSATLFMTSTPVLVQPTATATATPEPSAPAVSEEEAARTATVAAFLTQVASGGTGGGDGTVTPTTTALPDTGLMDEVGFPSLIGMALVLVAVIIFARRLRFSKQG